MDHYETIMGDVIHHARIEPSGYVTLFLEGGEKCLLNPYNDKIASGVSTLYLSEALSLVFMKNGASPVGEIFPMQR